MKTITLSLPLHEVLARLMFHRRIRTTELARFLNIPQPTLSRMVSGATTNPHNSSLKPIADYFQVTIEQLKGLEPIPWLNPSTQEALGWYKIPVLTWSQAVQWKGMEDTKDNKQIYTDANISKHSYALIMQDASMEPQFPKGTLLVIDPEKTPKDRSFVVVSLKDYSEALFRQLLIDGPHQYLKPVSPDFDHFKMILLDKEDKVSGVLVQARRDYEE